MPPFETRSSQFGLVSGMRQKSSDMVLVAEPAGLFAPEARKGQLYIVAGKLDRIVPWQDGEKLAHATSGPVEFLLIEDANHVANNRAYRYRTQSADWMARELGVTA